MRRRLLRVRLVTVGAAAATIVAAATALDLSGVGADAPRTGLGVPVASAAQVLERAAAASEAKPFVAPRDDQWIYTEERTVTGAGADPEIRRTWTRVDGLGRAWFDESGTLQVVTDQAPWAHPARPRPEPFDGYKAVAALPTGPEALLRWAYSQATHITNGPESTDDAEVYSLFNHLLRKSGLRPELEAGIFRAMKQIPGVTVETVTVFDRPTLAVGMTTSSWLREELLLDPATYTYRGERSTVIRDATIDPAKAGNATGAVSKGSQVIAERIATAIVDEPGVRR